jgi:hypothetical protein
MPADCGVGFWLFLFNAQKLAAGFLLPLEWSVPEFIGLLAYSIWRCNTSGGIFLGFCMMGCGKISLHVACSTSLQIGLFRAIFLTM